MIQVLQFILRPLFGSFSTEEFKKFIRLGISFTAIIGSYWTLRVLKNAFFCNLVGAGEIPYAKTASLILLVPLIMLYTYLLDRFNREKLFYIISGVYAALAVGFGLLLTVLPTAKCAPDVSASLLVRFVAYAGYIFVESYGSLIVALFWAIASDTTKPASAKQGFYFVTAIGQIGGIVGPFVIPKLPSMLGFSTNGFPVGICGVLILSAAIGIRWFFAKTPSDLLVSYHGINEKKYEAQDKKIKEKTGFFEGLMLLLARPYLLGIFASIFFFEFIVTIFDLHFTTMASMTYQGTALGEFLGTYGSSVNLVTLLCLLLGVSNIPKYLGFTVSLALMPLIIGAAILGFFTIDTLNFLFILMVGTKGLNYALNGPAIKQLYIPTTHDVRFKAQAWIESFGSRSSKEAGSVFNMLLNPLQSRLGQDAGRLAHVLYSSYVGFAIVVIWFMTAIYLGTTYRKAVNENRMVC